MPILGINLSIPNVAISGESVAAPINQRGTRLFAETGLPFMVISQASATLEGVHTVARAGPTKASRTYDLETMALTQVDNVVRGQATDQGAAFDRKMKDGLAQGVHVFWDNKDAGFHSPEFGAWTGGQGFNWTGAGSAAEETAERIIVGARDGGASGGMAGSNLYHVILTDRYDQDQMRRARDYFNGNAVQDK